MDTLDPSNPHYPLVVVVGPTSSGKSALAVAVAKRMEGEVLNFDSVQVYRGFDVGSGKLSAAERQGVPHHLVDIVEPDGIFSAGDYRREGLRTLESVRARGKLPVLSGGSGLYLRALLLGLFSGPRRSEGLRQRLRGIADRRGRGFLHRMLTRKDPASAARMHPRDTQKIIRALEVCFLARQPLSHLLGRGREGLGGFRVLKVGLDPPRDELCRRIDARVEQMYARGIIEEARVALERGGASIAALGALGYRQACALVQGKVSLDEAVCQTKTATRQYAKRQMTWFRREPDVHWFAGFGDDPEVEGKVLEWLDEAFAGGTAPLASIRRSHLQLARCDHEQP